MFLFMAVVYLVIPGIGIAFYHHPKVKMTFDHYDPEPGWMDRCPLPVLAVSLSFGLCIAFMAVSLPFIRFMAFCFGKVLYGIPGFLFNLVNLLFMGYLAWGTYRLRWGAWALSVVWSAFYGISMVWTFMRLDLAEFYGSLGYPDHAVVMMKQMGLSDALPVWTGGVFLVWTLYILWTGKYFKRG
jgi:hypothetical protein